MSVETIDLVRDTTMQNINEAMNVQNVILASIAGQTGGLNFTSFADIKQLVRLGLHKVIFHVGDQLVVERETALTATVGHTEESTGITAAAVNAETFLDALGTAHSGEYEFTYNGAEWHFRGEPVQLATYGITITGTPIRGDEIIVHETTKEIVFDVIGIDEDTPADSNFTHSLTLQAHDCVDVWQFDSTEALYYCETALEAGTYCFTLPAGYDTTYGGGQTYNFTLANDVPAGGVLMFPWAYNTQAANTKVSSYESRTASTAIESVSVTVGEAGTSLGTANGTSTNMNHIQRARYGSNNWLESDLRERLNSSAAVGALSWTPKSLWSRKPTWNNTAAGFMYGLDKDFVNALGKVTKTTSKNTVTDGGGGVQSEELFFLPSRSEVYNSAEIAGVNEGAVYSYYKNATNAECIKTLNGSARYWWLRTPYASYAYFVRSVLTSGALYGSGAYDTYGVAPACCII